MQKKVSHHKPPRSLKNQNPFSSMTEVLLEPWGAKKRFGEKLNEWLKETEELEITKENAREIVRECQIAIILMEKIRLVGGKEVEEQIRKRVNELLSRAKPFLLGEIKEKLKEFESAVGDEGGADRIVGELLEIFRLIEGHEVVKALANEDKKAAVIVGVIASAFESGIIRVSGGFGPSLTYVKLLELFGEEKQESINNAIHYAMNGNWKEMMEEINKLNLS